VLTRCGDDLFSITTESPQDAQALASHVRDSGDWLEVIPGIDSVVLQFDASTYDGDDVRQTMESVLAAGIKPLQISSSLVEICEATGMSAEDVIALHTASEYTVDMVGFTPGFAFIGGLDERLHVPRRKEPRQRVEAGSVGIADGRTGLYAMASPGGWTLIGRTPYKLFDPHAKPPFVLEAGMRVRFKAISADEFDG
jgi:inhibitor of KinA